MTLRAQPRQTAAEHERSLPLDERRRTGTVYTPAHLVEFILDQAGYTADSPIESRKLLDPACGCGAFLEIAVKRLVDRWRFLHPRADAARLLVTIESNLVGLDKDRRAAALATQLVRHTVGELVGPAADRETFFSANVTPSDFLDAPHAQLDLFRPRSEKRFDFIVGNPPYVTTTRLSADEKNYLRDRFITAHGRIDLYGLFFERALELLADGGILAFITPDKFLTSESAAPLRKLIVSQAAVRSVARFRSHRIFDGAATVPCVTVIQKAGERSEVAYLECADRNQTPRRIEVIRRKKVESPPSTGEVWHFLDPSCRRIAASLAEGHPPLEKLARRISAGIATGRDSIYVVPPKVKEELEEDLLHPCLRGQDLKAFDIESTESYVIIPYSDDSNGEPNLVDLEDYPGTHAYLESHRGDLETRHCVRHWGKLWYDIHDPWTLNVTEIPKILFPDLANSNRFVFDHGKYCPLHSAYYIIPSDGADPEYLTGLLNSTIAEFLIRLFAPLAKDGFSRYRKQFVKSLPIPQVGRKPRLSVVRAAASGDMAALDEKIADVFGLSARDSDRIHRFVLDARRSPRSAVSTTNSKAA